MHIYTVTNEDQERVYEKRATYMCGNGKKTFILMSQSKLNITLRAGTEGERSLDLHQPPLLGNKEITPLSTEQT